MYSRFTKSLIQIFDLARKESKIMKTNSITTEQLFIAVFKCYPNSHIIQKIAKESNLKNYMKYIEDGIHSLAKSDTNFFNTQRLLFTPKVYSVIEGALIEAEMMDHFHLGPEHLILSMCLEENIEPRLRLIFNTYNIDPIKLRTTIYKCIGDSYPNNLKKKISFIHPNRKKLVTAAYRQKYLLNEIKENNPTLNLCKFYALKLLKTYTNDRLIVGMREDDRIGYRYFDLNRDILNNINKKYFKQ